MRAADTVLIVISGKNGIAVGTEKAFEAASKRDLAKIFFVNGLCDESARFYRVFEDLKAQFGPSVCPVVVPFIQDGQANIYINLLEYKAYDYSGGKPVPVPMPDMGDRLEGLRTAIYEAVAETDDALFEKYFAGEEFTPEEVIVGVSKGVKSGAITPVFCGDAMLMRGMEQFLDGLAWLAPSAEEKAGEDLPKVDLSRVHATDGVVVEGFDNTPIKFAKCCSPLPGDPIVGFITRGFGVSIHKQSCVNAISSMKDPTNAPRWVKAYWADSVKDSYKAGIEIIALNRNELLQDVLAALADIRVPIYAVNARQVENNCAMVSLTIGINNTEHLNRVVARLSKVKDVLKVTRS